MQAAEPVIRVLFLCTGNACRSQMAEGWARALHPAVLNASSAGTIAAGLDSRAVQVMAEAGVDISSQHSKTVEQLCDARSGRMPAYDAVVTLCGAARETCPAFPGATSVLHFPFDDPPALAARARSEEEALQHYRRVRDEIKRCVERLPQTLAVQGAAERREGILP